MRTLVIFRDLGAILKYLSFIFLAPLIVSVVYNELLTLIIFAACFLLVFLFGRGLEKFCHCEAELKLPESLVVVALVWLAAAIFGSLPFLFYDINFLDAFFEAMSAWTTTGLSVVDVSALPRSLLFWRSIMQWVGGLGIVVLAFGGIFKTSSSLYFSEAREEQIKPNLLNTVKTMWWLYAIYTLLGIVALKIAGLSIFDAVNHAFTAIATGGMSTRVNGIAEFNLPAVEIVLMILMILGAVTFLTHYKLFKGKKFYKDPQLIFLIVLIIVFTGLALLNVDLRQSIFHVVSAVSGTGFNISQLGGWPAVSIFLLVILMIIGGSAGSTAGGLKLIRVLVFFKVIYWRLKKILKPHLVIPKRVGNLLFTNQEINAIFIFIGLYILILVMSSFVLMLYGYSLVNAFFQAASALGSVGLATVDTFGTVPKIVMIFDMWVGRLEIWAVLILFFNLWHRNFNIKN